MSRTARWSGRTATIAGCVVFAVVYLVIGVVRSDTALAVFGPVIMLGYGAFLLLFGRRSETVGLLGGDTSDERRRLLQLRATALTGNVLVAALVIGALVSLAVGSSTFHVFGPLCALAGLAWGASTVYVSRHG